MPRTSLTTMERPALNESLHADRPTLGQLDTKQLEAEIRELAAHLAAAEYRWLELIAEFDRRQGWAAWGMTSCAQWLSWQTALSPNAARERVRVAIAVMALPLTQAKFRRGRLSYSKVRAMTRVATPENEEELLHLARNATSYQLEQICRAWRGAQAVHDTDRAARQQQKLSFTWHWDDDGCLIGRVCVPPEDAAAVVASVDAALPSLPTAAERQAGVSVATKAQRRAQALVGLVQSGAQAGPAAAAGQSLAMIEVDAPVLTDDEPGRCQVRNGPTIFAEAARRLTCDATAVLSARGPDGATIGQTKPTKTIPASVRRALRLRDKDQCRFPGCSSQARVDAHHLTHRAHGGSHQLSNLVTLCKRHHHLVHEGGFAVSTPDGGATFQFHSPSGVPIPHTSGELPGADATQVANSNDQSGLQIDGQTLHTGLGERLDLELTVWALCNNHPVAERRDRCAGPPDQQG